MMYAEVAVNRAVNTTYHYHVPARLEGRVREGHLVKIGFGTAMEQGIVTRIHWELPDEIADIKTKPIVEILDPEPILTDEHLEWGEWLAEYYLAPIGLCLWLMLPPGIGGRSTKRVHLLDESYEGTSETQRQILSLLHEETPQRIEAVERVVSIKTFMRVLRDLEDAEVIEIESILTEATAKPKTVRTVMRSIPEDEVIDALDKLSRAPKQRTVFAYIAKHDYPIDVTEVYEAVDAKSADLNNLESRGLVQLGERVVYRDSLADRDFVSSKPLRLTSAQHEAWQVVRGAILGSKHDDTETDPTLALPDFREGTRHTEDNATSKSHHNRDVEDLAQARNDKNSPLKSGEMSRQRQRGSEDNPDERGRRHTDETGSDSTIVNTDIAQSRDNEVSPLKSGEMSRQRQRGSAFLLHGVTGSGKTEIYLYAIAETLKQGRQAIFLVPEIALTPQTIRRVAERFGDKVAVVHGSLSIGERYDTWRRARRGEIGVIVGTRSALFTPLPDVGLVILDEEHDHSYKQSPPISPPYYHARRAAEEFMWLNDGVLILGSATPDVETYYRAQNGELTYLHLPQRIMGHRKRVEKQAMQRQVTTRYQADEGDAMHIGLPPVEIVDMRDELKAGNTGMFSRSLRDSLGEVLERGEQAILMLNRRGQSTYVFCRDCGYVVGCDNCDTPMTYHRHGEAMRCHHCNHEQMPPTICPNCQSARIRYFGAGTQQVESFLRKIFPKVRAVRWDADTAFRHDMHEQILGRFADGEADVMIGTQMLAKGLDLPLVTLVGVVSADPGLALPDFRAEERAFQLLTQVAGRAGRGILGGKVVIQTYQPKHPSIVAASRHNYEQFYASEIAARRQLGYPPVRQLARVLIQNTHPIEAEREARLAADMIQKRMDARGLTEASLIGPAPCFFSRLDKQYRWQVLVRAVEPRKALEGLQLRQGWYMDLNPVDIL